MDGQRFDNLSRALARGIPRRTILKGLAGGALGSAAALPGEHESGATVCRQPGVLCTKDAQCCSASCGADHHCACPSETPALCGRTCVDPASDPNNCGDCGHVCQTSVTNAHPICAGGTCGYACDDGFMLCEDGACAPSDGCCTNDDCTSLSTACQDGVCQSDHTCATQAVDDDIPCPDGICCGGSCVDATANQHCGTCANACGAGTGCADGQCEPLKVCWETTCAVGATACCTSGDQCQDNCCYQYSPRAYTCCQEGGSYCDPDLGDSCQNRCCYGTNVGGDICCGENATGACDRYVGDSCQGYCCYGKVVSPNICCKAEATGYCTQGDSCSHYCCYGKDVGSNTCCGENAIGSCQSGTDCHFQCCYGSDCR